MRALAGKRGCGTRSQGGCYLESGLSDFGMPIEALLLDPPHGADEIGTPEWFVPHRTPVLVKDNDGVYHFVIWVGEEHYPNVHDFIEETRVLGASRKIPSTMDFSKVTSESRMIFVHPRALLDATPINELECPCPRHKLAGTLVDTFPPHTSFATEPACLGAAKYVTRDDMSRPGITYDSRSGNDIACMVREIPCGHTYRVFELPEVIKPDELKPRPAVFLQLRITGVAMINKRDGSFDDKIETRVRKAGVETFRADE